MDEDYGQWIRPRENTVEALVYGMSECDGVELDLRLSEDNRLVLHHDSCLLYTSPSPRDRG